MTEKPTDEELEHRVKELERGAIQGKRTEETLQRAHDDLETRDAERTSALLEANRKLNLEIEEGKLTEEALRESEENYRTLVESSPELIVIHDKGAISFVNHAGTKLLGTTSPNEIIGKPLIDFVAPEDQARVLEAIRETRQSKESLSLEKERFVRPDGTLVYVEITATPFDFKGRTVVQVVARDITERKLAEEALLESERKIRAIFDQTFQFMGLMTPDGTLIEANSSALGFGNVKESDVLGKPFWETPWWTHSQEMQERVRDAVKKAAAGKFVRFEAYHPGTDGELHYVDVSVKPVKDDVGNVIFLIPEGRDMTERRRAEDQLQQSETNFRQLAETLQDVFYLSDMGKGEILYISPSYEKIWGRTCESAYKNPSSFLDAVLPRDHNRVLANFREQRRGKSVEMEYRIVQPDGTIRWILSRAFPIKNEQGEYYRVAGIAQDITERKILEKELLDAKIEADTANQAKSAFLANMSHEIRTPVSAVLAMLHMTLDTKLEPDQKRNLGNIRTSTQSLLSIIDDILDFSKVEAGKLALAPEDFDLHALLKTCLDTFRLQAREKNIELKLIIRPEVPHLIRTDAGRLRQIINNLISNAVKFSEGGLIRIHLNRIGNADHPVKLHIEVSDCGIGIPAESLSGLFQTFSQLDTSYSKRYGGTGLGLAISKSLVEMMGGTIGVRSTPGVGSTFYFALPVQKAEAKTAPEEEELASAKHESLPPLAILVAEDEPLYQEYLLHILRKEGHRVVAVSDGSQAIEALKIAQFDLVLMDMQMPEVDGVEATKRIRRTSLENMDPHVPIIALTAYATQRDKDHILEAGVDYYISKPVDMNELRTAMTMAVGKEDEQKRYFKESRQPSGQGSCVEELKQFLSENVEDEEWMRRFLHRLAREVPLRMNLLKDAVAEKNWTRTAESAHQVVSLLGAVCISSTADCARELERAATNIEPEKIRDQFHTLEHQMSCLTEYLRREL